MHAGECMSEQYIKGQGEAGNAVPPPRHPTCMRHHTSEQCIKGQGEWGKCMQASTAQNSVSKGEERREMQCLALVMQPACSRVHLRVKGKEIGANAVSPGCKSITASPLIIDKQLCSMQCLARVA